MGPCSRQREGPEQRSHGLGGSLPGCWGSPCMRPPCGAAHTCQVTPPPPGATTAIGWVSNVSSSLRSYSHSSRPLRKGRAASEATVPEWVLCRAGVGGEAAQ